MGICCSCLSGEYFFLLLQIPSIVLTIEKQGRENSDAYQPLLAENEREAISALLQYLENVCVTTLQIRLLVTNIPSFRDKKLISLVMVH